jgi:hypothetical protein
MKKVNLEFWADSFHEGFWACEELWNLFDLANVRYEHGFIPVFLFQVSPDLQLEITIFGSYKNWHPLPNEIADLIEWGKPDLIAYDPAQKKIIFAMEETAAVPTGNQALQRCERMYGSLRSGVPFWYLLGEFGTHVDGGVRRDSIWPTILALKLSCIQRTPCAVLHYSDLEHPEDYSFGEGVNSLYGALAKLIGIHLGINTKKDLLPILTEQYRHMIDFIDSQWMQQVSHIPQKELLDDPKTAANIAGLVTAEEKLDNSLLDFFNWGPTNKLPKNLYEAIKPGGIIKPDSFIARIENIVAQKRAYTLSGNAGSRPQNKEEVVEWISQQKLLFKENKIGDARFTLSLSDFPKSEAGRLHLTTAKNVFYLIDSIRDIETAMHEAFPRKKGVKLDGEGLAFLYISNSLKPGRIFGDPFTGQLSAYGNIFTKNVLGQKTRIAVAYYPHQVHTQLVTSEGVSKKNKGITIMRDLLDYAIFQGGVLVNLKTGKIL